MDMDSDTMADSDTTARGLLMLRPIPTCFMEDLVTLDLDTPDTSDTMAMDSDIPTMARSADAEPEAKADPYYYGYGLGYAGHLGYYGHGLGYGYGRVYYGK